MLTELVLRRSQFVTNTPDEAAGDEHACGVLRENGLRPDDSQDRAVRSHSASPRQSRGHSPDACWDLLSVDAARQRLYMARVGGGTAIDLRSGAVTPTLVAPATTARGGAPVDRERRPPVRHRR